jgi:TRAP-type mannitol/chloroaromatic compound transport system substrate-binding protein
VELAASEATVWMTAKYDAENPAALRRLLGHGITLRPFSREIMLAAYKAAFELYEELAARNPRFKKVYDAWLQFRREEYTWFRISELSFDNFVASQIVQRS